MYRQDSVLDAPLKIVLVKFDQSFISGSPCKDVGTVRPAQKRRCTDIYKKCKVDDM